MTIQGMKRGCKVDSCQVWYCTGVHQKYGKYGKLTTAEILGGLYISFLALMATGYIGYGFLYLVRVPLLDLAFWLNR